MRFISSLLFCLALGINLGYARTKYLLVEVDGTSDGNPPNVSGKTKNIRCESVDGQYKSCPAWGQIAKLIGIPRVLPGSKACIPGMTYGFKMEKAMFYVWVYADCRAIFTVLLDDPTVTKPQKPDDVFNGHGNENERCGGVCCNRYCWGPCYHPCGNGLRCLDSQGKYALDSDGNGHGYCKRDLNSGGPFECFQCIPILLGVIGKCRSAPNIELCILEGILELLIRNPICDDCICDIVKMIPDYIIPQSVKDAICKKRRMINKRGTNKEQTQPNSLEANDANPASEVVSSIGVLE